LSLRENGNTFEPNAPATGEPQPHQAVTYNRTRYPIRESE